jgi:hypothetical protein
MVQKGSDTNSKQLQQEKFGLFADKPMGHNSRVVAICGNK